MGQFAQLFKIFEPFFKDLTVFFQAVGVIGVSAMVMLYKLLEIFSDVQQDQMYSQKTKKILFALVFIFLAGTIIGIIKAYFYQG